MNQSLAKRGIGVLLVLVAAAAGYQISEDGTVTPATEASSETPASQDGARTAARGSGGGLPDIDFYGGTPRSDARVTVLDNPGFWVGYSEAREQPLWVAYVAKPVRNPRGPERPRFEVDARTQARVHHRDYSNSGYTRGHLAPNFAISRLYGRDAQEAAFLMSNISPQTEDFNAGSWQRLEELEIDEWTDDFGALHVVTGPIFDARPRELRSGIDVPNAFFRVIVDLERDKPRAIALIVPHDAARDADLERYVTTIDAVEAATGLDLFGALADDLEASLEQAKADARWRMKQLGTRPGRYN